MDDFQSHSLPDEVIETFRLIGRKWAIVLLHELIHNPLSFGELKEAINGVSASVLSDLLSEFMDKGIIEKRSVSISPPRSAYFVTDFGNVLCDIIERIMEWGGTLVNKSVNVKVSKLES